MYVQDLPLVSEAVLPRGRTQDIPRVAATGFDLLQLPNGEQYLQQAALLLAYRTREEKSVARLGSRILLFDILGLQNKRKGLFLSALVGLWPLRRGPHHGYVAQG